MLLVILKDVTWNWWNVFRKRTAKKTNQKEFRDEKVIKTKGDKLYVKSKGYDDTSFNSWIDKKDIVKTSEYFPEPKSLGRLKVELDSSNYATKTDLKNATGFDTSSFAKKVDLASLKSNVDKLDIDKLKNVPTNLSNLKSEVGKLDFDKLLLVPVNLSKLSHIVKNDGVKKDVYNAEIKDIEDRIPDITNVASKTTPNAKMNEAKGDIPTITNLATKTTLNAKINEVKSEMSSTTNLATKNALNA